MLHFSALIVLIHPVFVEFLFDKGSFHILLNTREKKKKESHLLLAGKGTLSDRKSSTNDRLWQELFRRKIELKKGRK